MRKVLAWLGIGTAALLAAAVAGMATLMYQSAGLDQEAESYANAAVLGITSHWDRQQLLDRASPALRNVATPQQIGSLFDWFGTLGPLTSGPDCKGGISVHASIGSGTSRTGRYTCSVQYQNGAATVLITLVKLGDTWLINEFRVNSPALLPRTHEQKT